MDSVFFIIIIMFLFMSEQGGHREEELGDEPRDDNRIDIQHSAPVPSNIIQSSLN